MSYFNLNGRIALITGASSGFGMHFAKTLSAAGCAVGLAARRTDRLETLADDIRSLGGKALPLELDVSDQDAIEPALDRLEQEFGTVDLLINNAGVAGSHSLLDTSKADAANVIAINQTAVWDLTQSVSRRLIKARKPGAIVNISSITGLRPIAGAPVYAITKAAVAHMTKIQALELARHDIRVNAIAPGYFETELTHDLLNSDHGARLTKRIPMRRTGRLEELDGLLLLLSSDRSSFMTGAVIPVDGGHLISSL